MQNKETYWKTYFDRDTVARAEALRVSHQLRSTGVTLNVDVYEQASPDAPVFIFNHGGGGYSRLFPPLALELFERGYTVLLPDQIGQGFSGGTWRDLSVRAFVQNIYDVTTWARARYAGPLFLGGGSLGSGLAYQAAAAGAPVEGVICHNLYDFGNGRDGLAFSRFARAAAIPGVPALTVSALSLLSRILPGLPVPYRLLGYFDKMVDRREKDFYAKWQADPVPLKWVTLRYMFTLFTTAPAIQLEQNRLPVLVINPTRDEMVAPEVTRRNYERLGGPKAYAELDYGHWSTSEGFSTEWVEVVDAWCRRRLHQDSAITAGEQLAQAA